jgi:hypothetical protein
MEMEGNEVVRRKYLQTHMATPLRTYTRIHVKNWKDGSHFKIHQNTSEQTNHKKYRACDFKDLQFAMVKDVKRQNDGEEDAKHGNCKHGNSGEQCKYKMLK